MVAVCVLAIAAFYYMINAFQEPGPLQTNTHFTVRNGAGIIEIANNLERNDIISNARVFRLMTGSYLQKDQTPVSASDTVSIIPSVAGGV